MYRPTCQIKHLTHEKVPNPAKIASFATPKGNGIKCVDWVVRQSSQILKTIKNYNYG